MNKKLIIIAAAAGLVSFVGAFATGWLTKPAAALGSADLNQPKATDRTEPPAKGPSAVLSLTMTPAADDSAAARAMSEQQLKELIYEVREKIQEYNRKLQELEKEKERLQTAQQILKKDIETLNNLRVDLAASVAGIKSERDMLLKTRVEVEQVEKSNLVAIAAAYDRMDAASAAEILKSMSQPQTPNATAVKSANANDAVKILHFMQERTKAKVLAELAATEPNMAAELSQRLKQVTERK